MNPMSNKKNNILKRMPGHNIALSKEWVAHENKYHMSNRIISSGNKKQLGRMLNMDLNSNDERVISMAPYMLTTGFVANEETYSVCITQGSSLRNSLRVTGSIKNANVPQSALFCKSILDRFGESGHDLQTVTECIKGFYSCWDAIKDSCNDKNKIMNQKNISAEQVFTLGEDGNLKRAVIQTNSFMIGKDSNSKGSIMVKKLNVFVNNSLVHETVFMQQKRGPTSSPVSKYTITTNIVRSNTNDVIAASKNKDLARMLHDGNMIRSSFIVGLPYHIISYNMIDYNHNGYETLGSDIKLNAKDSGDEKLNTCLQAFKSDVDNMNNMVVVLDNALTKIFLIQGDKYDVLKLDSISVLP